MVAISLRDAKSVRLKPDRYVLRSYARRHTVPAFNSLVEAAVLLLRAKDSDEINLVLERTILFGEPVHVGTCRCLIQQAKHRCGEKAGRIVHPITLSLDPGT